MKAVGIRRGGSDRWLGEDGCKVQVAGCKVQGAREGLNHKNQMTRTKLVRRGGFK